MKISNTMHIKNADGKFDDVKISYIEPNYCTAEGKNTTASGDYSHAEGYYATASGETSHAEGYETTASGGNSHAEGWGTEASGFGSHAEGSETAASGQYSHAEGRETTAFGASSHAEGKNTIASGYTSHAEGLGSYSTIKLKKIQGDNGIGYSLEDRNLYGTTVKTDSLLQYGGKVVTITSLNPNASPEITVTPSENFTFLPTFDEFYEVQLIIGGIASGLASHAEGSRTEASGDHSHAEGYETTASGDSSHAEGSGTIASGQVSHAEGLETTASGYSSHAGGVGTIAAGNYQTAIGKYNIKDEINDYAFIIGNGDHINARSNAFAITWDGEVVVKNNTLPLTPVYSGYMQSSSVGTIPSQGYVDVVIKFPAEFFYNSNPPIVTPSLVHTNATFSPYLSVFVSERKVED